MPKFTSAEVEIVASDKTGGTLKSVGERVGSLTKLVKSYWAEITAAYLVMKKVVSVLNDWVKESREQEQAVMKLNTVLKSMGSYTFETSKEMQDFASSMELVTKFSDDVIINGQALMATFKQIGWDVFPQAMESAMDLSTIFEQDLQTSVIQVGKALNDPIAGITSLKKIGVSFTETQKDQIKHFIETNQLAKAQAIILKELADETGNAGRAMGLTAGGQAEILQHKIANLKKELGFMIDSEMPAFLELANRIADTLMRWAGAINANKKALKEWRDQVADMNKTELTEAIRQQDAVVQSLANQIKPIQDVIEKHKWLTKEYRDAVKAYNELIPQYDDSIKKLYGLNEALKNYDKTHKEVKKTTEDIAPVLKEVKIREIEYTDELVRATEAQAAYNAMMYETDKAANNMAEGVKTAKDAIAAFSSSTPPIVEDLTVWQTALGYFKDYVENDFQPALVDAWESIWTSTGDTFGKIKEAFKGMVAQFLIGLAKMYAAQAVALMFLGVWGRAAKLLAASAGLYAAASVVRSLAKGGEFVTQGPELMVVGDNPSGRERVSVTPAESPAYNQPQGGGPIGGDVYFDGDKVGHWIARQVRSKNIPIYKGALVSS